MRVVLNSSPFDERFLDCDLRKVSWLILNEVEGQQMTDCSAVEPKQILEQLRKRYPQAACVLTLGTAGAYYQDAHTTAFQDTFRVKSVDSTEAGDTFTGFFLAGMARGCDTKQAMRRAAAAAAISVSRRGASTSVPTNQDVRQFLNSELV